MGCRSALLDRRDPWRLVSPRGGAVGEATPVVGAPLVALVTSKLVDGRDS